MKRLILSALMLLAVALQAQNDHQTSVLTYSHDTEYGSIYTDTQGNTVFVDDNSLAELLASPDMQLVAEFYPNQVEIKSLKVLD